MPVTTRRAQRAPADSHKRKRETVSPDSDPYEVSDEDELASDSDYSDTRQIKRTGKGLVTPGRSYISDKVLESHRTVSYMLRVDWIAQADLPVL